MTWRTARSIPVLFDQLQRAAPAAAPHGSGGIQASEWGTIGDAEHDPTSDHSPKDFPGWGQDIVTAGDFPNRPGLGLDAHARLDSIRRSHDTRVKYGISNDQIFSSYATASRAAWTWGPYNPNDPTRDRHLTHGHLSVVGDARADGTQPWSIGGTAAADTVEDEDMGQSLILPAMPGDVQKMSYRIPAVEDGAADPRATWFCMGRDQFGARSAWRIWIGYGTDGLFEPLPGTQEGGILVLQSMRPFSVQLPKGTRIVSVTRWGLANGTTPVDPTTPDALVDALPMVPCLERA